MTKIDSSIVQIFSPAGFDRGFSIVELDNWNGTCVIAKKSVFKRLQKRPEFLRPGVYILHAAPSDGALPRVYVGEADPLLPRLQRHYQDLDFWTDVIAFSAVGDALTKTRIQYIEHRLVARASVLKLCDLENKNKPDVPTLSESERAYLDRFIEKMVECLTVLNIRFFHEPERVDPADQRIFELKGKGAFARGFPTENGFTVAKGSTATKILTTVFKSGVLREKLINGGVLVDDGEVMRFTQDWEFSSPSAAAMMVYGNPMNGLEEWKTVQGQTLKQTQESDLMDSPTVPKESN